MLGIGMFPLNLAVGDSQVIEPLTRRDLFAAMALQGLLANSSNESASLWTSIRARAHADALIMELDGPVRIFPGAEIDESTIMIPRE